MLWTANARDAELHLLQQTAGNGVVTTQTFNANTGLISAVQAGASNAVADLTFGFDTLGNLVGRSDLNQSLAEAFTYDSLNRLTGYDVLGGVVKTVTYDGIGNILTKSDVGTYSYNAAGGVRPHGVQSIAGTLNASYSYDANGNVTADGTRTMTWTSFNMVAEITQGTTTVSFHYDSAHARFKQTTADGDTLYVKDAGSGLTAEKLAGASGSVKWTEYLVADGGLVGQHTTVTPAGGGSATSSVRYFVLDHLGSVSVVTDETGTVVERLSYDAWGKRRFATGADDPSGSIISQTTRGYTGHEHIPEVGLINMNGRVQEPYIARFVSADPIIQDRRDGVTDPAHPHVRFNIAVAATTTLAAGFVPKDRGGASSAAGDSLSATDPTPAKLAQMSDPQEQAPESAKSVDLPCTGFCREGFATGIPAYRSGGHDLLYDGQFLNSYGYVNNNPLALTDPTGELANLLIGAGIGVGLEVLYQASTGKLDGSWGSIGRIGLAGLSGATGAGISAQIGKLAVSEGAKFALAGAAQSALTVTETATKNAMDGEPLADDLGTAAVVGGVLGTAGRFLGEVAKDSGRQLASQGSEKAQAAAGAIANRLSSAGVTITKKDVMNSEGTGSDSAASNVHGGSTPQPTSEPARVPDCENSVCGNGSR